MRAIGVGTALALVAVMAGCDGGKSAGDAPRPAQSLGAFANQVEAAVTSPSCRPIDRLTTAGQLSIPCPRKFAGQRSAFRGFRVRGVEDYYTGGVIDFTDHQAPRGATWVTALDRQSRWTIVAAPILGHPTVGTKPADEAAFREAVDGFLEAVRDNDCGALQVFLAPPPNDIQGVPCQTRLLKFAELRVQLAEHPDAEPVSLGGNRQLFFYGLYTGTQYRTLPVIETGPGAVHPYQVLASLRAR
ncbi:MAG: hypothetical protein AABM29_06800 [Actinomycetota bacterium]